VIALASLFLAVLGRSRAEDPVSGEAHPSMFVSALELMLAESLSATSSPATLLDEPFAKIEREWETSSKLLSMQLAQTLNGETRGDELRISNSPSDAGAGGYDGWQLILTPNGFVPMMDGDITIGDLEAPINVHSEEIKDSAKYIDWAAAFYAELRKGMWGIFAEGLIYNIQYDAGADVEVDIFQRGVIGRILQRRGIDPSLEVDVDGDLEYTQAIAELGLAYRIVDTQFHLGESDHHIIVDLIAGGRYWYFNSEARIDLDADLNVGPISRSRSRSIHEESTRDWIDPFIGARAFISLTDRLDLTLRGDVGGFGINSDFAWRTTAALEYYFTQRFSIYGGYQGMGVDYATGNGGDRFELDAVVHGPTFGVAYRFGGPSGPKSDDLAAIQRKREREGEKALASTSMKEVEKR
jgi:hypothetical protein